MRLLILRKERYPGQEHLQSPKLKSPYHKISYSSLSVQKRRGRVVSPLLKSWEAPVRSRINRSETGAARRSAPSTILRVNRSVREKSFRMRWCIPTSRPRARDTLVSFPILLPERQLRQHTRPLDHPLWGDLTDRAWFLWRQRSIPCRRGW